MTSSGSQTLRNCLQLLADLGETRAQGRPLGPQQMTAAATLIWPLAGPCQEAIKALCSPYLALTMLWRTLGQGFRGNPHHPRPLETKGQRLSADLLAFLRLHLRIISDLPGLVEWPPSGVPAETIAGDGGWCDLCGECCCHSGTVSAAPAGVAYPAYFHHALAGEILFPQPFCPFLFQALGQPLFFCGLHPIKPLACRCFDQQDCQRGRQGRGYLPNPSLQQSMPGQA
ncbi:MAG: hypothetical protein PVG03_03735 [Desulfarculaceae bacterium]